MSTQRTSYDFSRNKALWEVDDTFLENPRSKFDKTSSPLIEATVEMWGCYQFDQVKHFPEAMIHFVTNFVGTMGIIPSKYTNIGDVCSSILCRIDYEEPYFFLVDTLIQMSHNELTHSYRHRGTGDILNPARLETFKINREWTFKPFWDVKKVMEEPRIVEFLSHNIIPSQFKSRDEAILALFAKIGTIVWGNVSWLEGMVEEAISSHAENLIYDNRVAHDEQANADVHDALADDKLFWMAGALGLVTWLKGPNAVSFLTQYHTIYDNLLCVNDDGTVTPWPDTGDEVVVDSSTIYTHKDLEFLPNRPADTCMCCKIQTHCSKELNVTALLNPTCSCGQTLDPMVTDDPYGYHNHRNCQAYKEAHPVRTGFVCQRCIFMTVNQLGQHTKCGRTICPAVTCPHHMGPLARVQALTHQRTKQLTAPQRG